MRKIGGMATSTTPELDAQYRLLREEAGLVDRSARGKLLVSGAEAAEYLQGQLTNDVEGVARGEGCYAALLDRKGRMQADMRVLRFDPERIWLDTEPEGLDRVVRHLGMYRVGRDVELSDLSEEWAILSVLGPAAAARLGQVQATAGQAAERLAGEEHTHLELELSGEQAHVVAAWPTGVDLLLPSAAAGSLRAQLAAAGVPEVSEEAAEVLRVEGGRPRFGREMTNETIPQEAGINERAVSFTKGCYIGQETVARLHYKGKPNRSLRGLRLDAPVEEGEPVRHPEREVGRIGTSVLSPARGPLALAVLRREAEPGTRVEVGESRVGAEVCEVPFG